MFVIPEYIMKRPVLSSKQYGAAQRVGYTTDDLGFKSWQEQKTYLFSKTSRPAPAPTQPPNPVLSQAVKWPVQTVRPLPSVYSQVYISVELYLNTTCWFLWHILLQLYFTSYLCTYLSTAHVLLVLKRYLLYITYPLHAHYMNHLFHLHCSN